MKIDVKLHLHNVGLEVNSVNVVATSSNIVIPRCEDISDVCDKVGSIIYGTDLKEYMDNEDKENMKPSGKIGKELNILLMNPRMKESMVYSSKRYMYDTSNSCKESKFFEVTCIISEEDQ